MFKEGDRVTYDGHVGTVIQVSEEPTGETMYFVRFDKVQLDNWYYAEELRED